MGETRIFLAREFVFHGFLFGFEPANSIIFLYRYYSGLVKAQGSGWHHHALTWSEANCEIGQPWVSHWAGLFLYIL